MKKSPPREKLVKPLSVWTMFWKAGLLSLFITLVMLLITGLILGLWGYGKFRQFLSAAEVSQTKFINQVKAGWRSEPTQTEGFKNLLVLGTDSAQERGDVPPLTDTMMLVSINLSSGEINTLPLPRDLWNEDYQTKINALYAYGAEHNPDKPEQFPATVITQMTGVPIHHTLILSFTQLKELVDLVGGVEVNIENGFTDTQYPREGIDVTTERDPAVLYETITFESGQQTLTGARVLQYIRSRHSEDDQGHDLLRGARQQQVIAAVVAKLTNPVTLIRDPRLAGKLYLYYEQNFSQYLPVTELISTVKALLPHRDTLAFQSHQLTDIDDDPDNGVLENPPQSWRYQNQWVYLVNDEAKFKSVIDKAFFAEN
jgi:anionic cell wall polymer biosynthesis LytR-Cps2A-Psr (LCP) family protein